MSGIIFNKITKDFVDRIRRDEPFWAPRTVEVLEIAGRPGGVVSEIKTDVMTIPVTIFIKADTRTGLYRAAEEVADWFNVDEPKILSFSDDPDRHRFAIPTGLPSKEDMVANAQLTVDFVCPDPYKYGDLMELTSNPASPEPGVLTFTTDGTASTPPIIEYEVKEDVTFLQAVKHTGEYLQIGNPNAVDDVVIDPNPVIFNDNMSSMDKWNAGGIKGPENGNIGGSWAVAAATWFPSFYTPNNAPAIGWQGPMKRANLSRNLNDFRAEVMFTFRSWRQKDVNKAEFYLIDSNNNNLGKVTLKTTSANSREVTVDIGIGPGTNRKHIVKDFYGFRRGSYNEFFGKITIERKGNVWFGQVGLRDADGRYHNRSNEDRYVDERNVYDTPLASLQLWAAAYLNRSRDTVIYVHSVRVTAINQPTSSELPLIAKAGDIIRIDHEKGEILLNGENVEYLKDFGSTYFDLDKGFNDLFIYPETAFDVRVRYRDRYL